jgi:hypothetical protein
VSYEAKEADAVGAGSAASEEAGNGKQETDNGEDDWDLINDNDRSGWVVS